MEILYFLSALCLVIFMVLATYDGFYLHIFKYELFNHEESTFEHKIHAVRSALFPIITWLLFIENSKIALLLGMVTVMIDLIVLAIDAYSEKDSRSFMGGLPKWEYILHLFANGFHFAAIVLIIATKITIVENNIIINTLVTESFGSNMVNLIAVNIIPGAIILAFFHAFLLFTKGKNIWNKFRSKIVCC